MREQVSNSTALFVQHPKRFPWEATKILPLSREINSVLQKKNGVHSNGQNSKKHNENTTMYLLYWLIEMMQLLHSLKSRATAYSLNSEEKVQENSTTPNQRISSRKWESRS